MTSPSGALDLPQRLSLSAQTATAIRKAVGADAWQEILPGERRLCDIFQVRRPTARTAFRQLARKGLIGMHQGRCNRIRATARLPHRRESRLVVRVSPQPISQMTLTSCHRISEKRTHLAEQGFTTEELVCPGQSATAQRRKLETFPCFIPAGTASQRS